MRDYCGFGGIANKFGFTPKICAGEFQGDDLAELVMRTEFDDPALFNENSKIAMKGDPANIKIPFYTAISLEQAFIHTRGTSEININSSTPAENKYMDITSEVGVHYWMYGKDILDRHKKFFAHWLKGEKDGLADKDPIHMMVRTGGGGFYWQNEKEWPIARTEYKKLYPNAVTGDFKAPNALSETVPANTGSVSYPADEENQIMFVTPPMEEDVVIGGYVSAKLFLSSSSNDMAALAWMPGINENEKND